MLLAEQPCWDQGKGSHLDGPGMSLQGLALLPPKHPCSAHSISRSLGRSCGQEAQRKGKPGP